jgi:UDP-4-amino-4,6-dideoxy-N-acetyl-beta-L-altrosamine transaminase
VIPYGRQSIDEDDIASVVAVLRSDFLTQGPAVEEFEDRLAGVVGARHAVAFANGTAALHAACAAAGLGPGDRLVTTPLTFVASANCGRYVGATVGFVDIDPETLNLDPRRVPADTDALVAVHYAGLPVDLSALGTRPRVVIEDAAHAIGAATADGPIGNCARSDMTCFSFHPVKTITTGEGGAVTTNDPRLADALRRFRTHGIERMPERGGWYYEAVDLGFNYRLTDLQAALGSSQLRKLRSFVARREELARRYDALLADLPVLLPPAPPPGVVHGRHLYPVRVAERDRVYAVLRAAGIGVQVHYVPVTHHPSFGLTAADRAMFPATERAYAGLLSLPLHPSLTEDEQRLVAEVLGGALSGAPGPTRAASPA